MPIIGRLHRINGNILNAAIRRGWIDDKEIRVRGPHVHWWDLVVVRRLFGLYDESGKLEYEKRNKAFCG